MIENDYLPINLSVLKYSGNENPVEFIQSKINEGVLPAPLKYQNALFIVERHKDDNSIDRYNYFARKEYLVDLINSIRIASENENYSSLLRQEFLGLDEIITNGVRMANPVSFTESVKFWKENFDCDCFLSKSFLK
jgi:hypothetical protein